MPIQFETHRNCITNDLFTTLQLLDAMPEMRLSADLSHYVVDREMMQPTAGAAGAMSTRILERSDSFQGRIATRGQVQLPLDFPQHAKWVDPVPGLVAARLCAAGRHAHGADARRPCSSANSARATMRSPMPPAASCRIAGPRR